MPTHEAKFPKGEKMTVEEVAAVVGDSFKEMNENPPEAVLKVREEMEGKVARQRLTWNLTPTVQKMAAWVDILCEEIRADYNRGTITSSERSDLINAVKNANSKKEAEQILADHRKRRTAASGLYGFNKTTQNACEAAARKLARHALRVAKRAFAKDANVVSFLQTHVKRENSKSARVLLAAMKEIGPKLASEIRGGHPKEAGEPEYGLYGFRSKTADLGLDSCKEVRTAAGRITADLHRRKADLHEKLTGFWKEHSKQAKCAYAGMLLSCYPDASMKYATRGITGSVLPHTNRFVHTSKDLRAESGNILDAQVLPSELAAFRNQVVATFGRPLQLSLGLFKEANVSAFVNADGRTRDVDGTVVIHAHDGESVVASADVGFTGVYEPGPLLTVLASGDFLEWEE